MNSALDTNISSFFVGESLSDRSQVVIGLNRHDVAPQHFHSSSRHCWLNCFQLFQQLTSQKSMIDALKNKRKNPINLQPFCLHNIERHDGAVVVVVVQ